MICYKAQLAGIRVRVVRESYTSGTSYLDGERPEKKYYNATRRVKRGMFKSDRGILINLTSEEKNVLKKLVKTLKEEAAKNRR